MRPLWKAVQRLPKKLKMERPYDAAVPLLCVYPREMGTGCRRDIFTPPFTAVLFTIIAKVGKQPKCSLRGE